MVQPFKCNSQPNAAHVFPLQGELLHIGVDNAPPRGPKVKHPPLWRDPRGGPHVPSKAQGLLLRVAPRGQEEHRRQLARVPLREADVAVL